VNVLGQLQTLLAPTTSPAKLDETTISMLQNRIKEDKAWNKTSAIRFLGKTENPVYADIYIDALNDESDRVINVAAIALGQSKSPKALEALEKLVKKPSWKNQSLISALYGMKALGDARAYDTALKALLDVNSAHWSLATPVWDYRMTAVETIVALGKSEAAYPELFKIFKNALTENDLYGTFYNLMLLNSLADPRGKEAYELLKIKFKNDTNIMTTISQYEAQYQSVIKK
jgi:tetratricopeptide (TPR) repeat protein